MGVKGEELLALPREKTLLRWVRAGERAGFVVVPVLFHVKNERVKSVGWKFFARSRGRWVSSTLANQNRSSTWFPLTALEVSASLKG